MMYSIVLEIFCERIIFMKAKKIIIPIAVIAGIAAIGGGIIALGNAASNVTYAETVQISRKTLEDRISVNGTVESSEKKNVYAELSYPVEKINVSVGDIVKKGDILCTIDTEELQQQILQQQATVDNSGVNSDYNLSEAERRYQEALDEYNNGENSLILNAKKALEQAERSLDDAKRQQSLGKETTLPSNAQNADASLENARMAYENSKKAYEDAEKALDPDNYPADVKLIKEKLDEAKEMLDKVEKEKYISEIERAKIEYEDARQQYNSALAQQDSVDNTYLEDLSNDLANKKMAYEAAVQKYDEETLKEQVRSLQTQYDSAVESLEKARDSAKINMDNAKLSYDNAAAGRDNVNKQNEGTEENYSIAVKNAEEALENARSDYDLAVRQAETELSSLKKAAEQQRTVSGLNDPQVIILENLKEKLNSAVVTAPCDGIVTAVNTEEGAMAAGALFTIENIDDLKISAAVGEYDIPYIKEGMDTVIRCDALGDDEFSGKVTEVSKTPVSSAVSAQTGTNYKIEVSIDKGDERILAGMSAKLNIISSKKDGALTVTYDALTADEDGNDALFIAEKGDDGVYKARLVPVEVGMETDYEIEVISDELKEGMYVLTDTSTVIDGSVVMIDESEAQEE